MTEKQLLDAIEDMSPQGHYVLLLYIANHLLEAVDDGLISAVVLQQAADHLKMLVEHGRKRRGLRAETCRHTD